MAGGAAIPCIVQVPAVDHGAPGRSGRANDRSLAAAIAVSLAGHALVILAILAIARIDGMARPRPRDAVAGGGQEVVLLPDPGSPPRESAAEMRSSQPEVAVVTAPAAPTRPIFTAAMHGASAGEKFGSGDIGAGAPSAGAPVTAPVVLDPAIGSDYRHRLLDHIAAFRHAPSLADGEPASGTVIVRFSLSRAGDVATVAVVTSSGQPDLDDEAVATIWRARPMPPIPPVLPEHLSVVLPAS